jgi:hypothetical protein
MPSFVRKLGCMRNMHNMRFMRKIGYKRNMHKMCKHCPTMIPMQDADQAI